MSLTGDLRTMPLPDVLQWISIGRKTGTLHLRRGSVHKQIVFRDGAIFSSSSNDPRESLAQFLLRDRRLGEEQLFRAMLVSEEEGRPLGAILVSSGILDEADLLKTLEHKAEEAVYDLFLWPEGRFEFAERQLPPEVYIHVEMEVTAVLLEGLRRFDEWNRMKEVLPNGGVTFEVSGTISPRSDLEREALRLAAAGHQLASMGLELYLSDFATACLFFALWQRGAVVVKDAREGAASADRIGAIRDLLTAAYRRLEQRHLDGAQKAYEDVLALDRLNQHAKKGLLAVAEARGSVGRTVQELPLHKVPRLAVELTRLTGGHFDPQEAFVLSRINGEWDVRSILKLCPMEEEQALLIFHRLVERGVVELREPRRNG